MLVFSLIHRCWAQTPVYYRQESEGLNHMAPGADGHFEDLVSDAQWGRLLFASSISKWRDILYIF